MKTIFRLAKTELRILFCSPVSWLILVIFAFQAGINFSDTFGGLLKRQALEYGLGWLTENTYGRVFRATRFPCSRACTFISHLLPWA